MAYKTGKRQIELTREEVLGIIAEFAGSPDEGSYIFEWFKGEEQDVIIFNDACMTGTCEEEW